MPGFLGFSQVLHKLKLVISYIDHWGDKLHNTLIKNIQLLQNSAAKLILDRPKHSSELLRLLRCLWISGVLLLPSFLVDLCDWWPTALNAMLGQLWKYSCGLHYTSSANSNDLKDRRNSYHINGIIGRQIDFKYKTYRSVHPLFGRRALSGKELSGGAPDVLRVKTRCNLSHCRSNRQIDFKYKTYRSVHPLFGRCALSGKELSGGAPDVLRVKTRCNLSHCRSNRQIDFKHKTRTEVFTRTVGATRLERKGTFGRRAWCSEGKNTL